MKLKTISALILAFSTAVTVFYGCTKKDDDIPENTTSTETTTVGYVEESNGVVVYTDEHYTYHSQINELPTVIVTGKNEQDGTPISYAVVSTTEFVPITIIPEKLTSVIHTTKANKTTVKQTTTKRAGASSTEVIKEESKGINVLTKTTPVFPGNTATITVLGKPDKKYTIDFYEEGSVPSVATGLEDKTANEYGFVSWTFSISPLCSAGNKKIIIKEIGSDNYIQTSIKVN